MALIDETHNLQRRSFVTSANGHSDFSIQNLPLGVFSLGAGEARVGVAIGEEILDLRAAVEVGLFDGEALETAKAADTPPLNAFLALGIQSRRTLRRRLSTILSRGSAEESAARACLRTAADCQLHLPVRIGDYTDFYVGIHHATHVGKLFRPDNPLLPNYKHVPIGYHGRASSILPSRRAIHRPNGQTKAPNDEGPTFGPSCRLDYELELGILVGPGNALGTPVDIAAAREHIGGYCLLNDWSARDIQAWEYQPLGPFLAKNFASTISPWIVLPEALEPFRIAQAPRAERDPRPLAYLFDDDDQREGALAIEFEVLLSTQRFAAAGLPPQRLARSHARHMYWTPAQMLAHHTSSGCNLNPGDLLGSGTISGPDLESAGSLLEATEGGQRPIRLASGEERRFLDDGDEIILRAQARRTGFVTIGFGECRAKILPAPRDWLS